MTNPSDLEAQLSRTIGTLEVLHTERYGLLQKDDPASRQRLDEITKVEIPNLERQLAQLQASLKELESKGGVS